MWRHLPNLAGNWCFQVPSGVLKRSKVGKASNSNGGVSHYNSSRHHRIRTCLLFISWIIYIDIHQNMIQIYFNIYIYIYIVIYIYIWYIKTMYIYIFSLLCPRHFPTFHALKPGPRQMFLLWTIRLHCKRPRRRGGRMTSFQLPGRGFLAIQPGLFFAFFFADVEHHLKKNENVFVGNDIPVGWGLGHCTNPCSREGYGQFHHLEIRFTQKEIRQGRELRHFSFIFSRLPQLTNKVLGAALINDFVGIYHKFWNWTRYFSEYRRSLL